jgi:hypothetical protein
MGEKVMQVGFENEPERQVTSGEYMLEDGSKIQVDGESVIVLVQEKGTFSIPEQKADTGGDKAEKFGTVEAEGANGAIVINFPGDALEEGAAITTPIEEVETPVPTGEYILSDGTILVVVEEGIVGEVKAGEEEEDLDKDGLKGDQIDALINGIAEIISTFKTDVQKQSSDDLAAMETRLRTEFNKPAAKVKSETPEDADKKEIVRGLNKFVTNANDKTKK